MCVAQPRCPGMDTSSCLPGIGKIVGLRVASEGAPGAARGPVCCPHPGKL